MLGTEHQSLRFLQHQFVSDYNIVRGKDFIASIKHQNDHSFMAELQQQA